MSQLKQVLNVRGLTLIAVGGCIGSGIFVTPSSTVTALPHHGWALVPWIIGGLVSFFGAMTFSELGTRFPKEGGVYVYLKEAYGDIAGFLYGWITLFIVNTGALAALSLAFVNYLSLLMPITDGSKPWIAIALLWILTIINTFGVNISQSVSSIFTILKLGAMLMIILIGLYFLPDVTHTLNFDLTSNVPPNLMQGILVAFVGVFWSMGGWHHATYLAGEAVEPQKTVPRAMLYGTSIVTLVYLAIIIAYMILLPIDLMSSSTKVAGDAAGMHLDWGGRAVSIAICLSVMGSIAIYTMSAPRIYFAMARDGIFFKFLAEVSPRFKTPINAMYVQTAWASVLVLGWGAFDKLATFVTFMDIVFMALATAAIFVFRNRDKEYKGYMVRPYPIIPIIYLLVTIVFVINTLFTMRNESWVGMIILGLGVLVFFLFKKDDIGAKA
jgi:basic amino acid/polyamine antiporter, APA family